MTTATAAVNKWVRKSRRAALAVVQQSTLEVANIANTPVSEGGRMRIDTGFLRNSQSAAIGSAPSGPSDPARDPQGSPAEDIALVLANAKVGDVIFIGWSANYARPREYIDGFLESAVQKWPSIVRKNAALAKKEQL